MRGLCARTHTHVLSSRTHTDVFFHCPPFWNHRSSIAAAFAHVSCLSLCTSLHTNLHINAHFLSSSRISDGYIRLSRPKKGTSKAKKKSKGRTNRRPVNYTKFTMGSDCAGCEGIVKVVQDILGNQKVDHAFSCDSDASVKRFILQNHDPAVWFDDVAKRCDDEIPEVECYTAGFPCQPFSSAGKKKDSKTKEER